jgi:hypothetical protein
MREKEKRERYKTRNKKKEKKKTKEKWDQPWKSYSLYNPFFFFLRKKNQLDSCGA